MLILFYIHETNIPPALLEFYAQFITPRDVNTRFVLVPRVHVDQAVLGGLAARIGEYFNLEETDIELNEGDTITILREELNSCKPDLLVYYPFKAQTGLETILHSPLFLQVVREATCPVLFPKGVLRPIQRILVCDSGGRDANPLITYTTKLAKFLVLDEQITVLHVMSQIAAGPGVPGKQLRMDANDLMEYRTPEGEVLEKDIKIIESSGIHPTAKVRHGFVDEEILAEAASGDYDLVLIGAHEGKGWQRFLLEDLARKILIKMDRPVLVVK